MMSESTPALPGPPTIRNPDWTPEETLLGLEAYLRLRPRMARQDLDVIIELSGLLQLYGRLRGVAAASTFRNPAGVARKVFKFTAAERGQDPNTIGGAELEKVVWDQYGGDPDAVARAADALRLDIYAKAAAMSETPMVGTTTFKPSQGPAPSFGQRTVEVNDSDCVVYVLALDPIARSLFDTLEPDDDVLKVGRSNAVDRRVRALNGGFPPAMRCGWRVCAVKPYSNAQSAHDAEQRLIARLASDGRSLGGEFFRAPISTAEGWLQSGE